MCVYIRHKLDNRSNAATKVRSHNRMEKGKRLLPLQRLAEVIVSYLNAIASAKILISHSDNSSKSVYILFAVLTVFFSISHPCINLIHRCPRTIVKTKHMCLNLWYYWCIHICSGHTIEKPVCGSISMKEIYICIIQAIYELEKHGQQWAIRTVSLTHTCARPWCASACWEYIFPTSSTQVYC